MNRLGQGWDILKDVPGNVIPPVDDPVRRQTAMNVFLFFCRTYFASIFYKEWTVEHRRIAASISRATLPGARGAVVKFDMRRGQGNTYLSLAASLWAVLNGTRHSVVIVGGDTYWERRMRIDDLVAELEANEPLFRDFPDELLPFRALDCVYQRCGIQTYMGDPTEVVVQRERIVFAKRPKTRASGATITIAKTIDEANSLRLPNALGKLCPPELVLWDCGQEEIQ